LNVFNVMITISYKINMGYSNKKIDLPLKGFVMNVVVRISVLFFLVLTLSACGGVSFQSYAPSIKNGDTIRATVFKPEGSGPFPAIIVLDGCSGLTERADMWALRLRDWGYLSMIVDSHSSRGGGNCSTPRRVTKLDRALDAHAAKTHLKTMPEVDPRRIGIIGFSEGAGTILEAINTNVSHYLLPEGENTPFNAAVAFYPFCTPNSIETDVSTLILVGEEDDWTPAAACLDNLPQPETENVEIKIKNYPGAHHCFDWVGKNMNYLGHTLRYNHTAAEDAKRETKNFFSRHLKVSP